MLCMLSCFENEIEGAVRYMSIGVLMLDSP